MQVRFQAVVGLIVEPLDRSLFQCSIYAFDLAVGPRVVRLGEPVFDIVLLATPIEHSGAP